MATNSFLNINPSVGAGGGSGDENWTRTSNVLSPANAGDGLAIDATNEDVTLGSTGGDVTISSEGDPRVTFSDGQVLEPDRAITLFPDGTGANIQAAIDAADAGTGPKRIILAEGTHVITDMIVYPTTVSDVVLEGEGIGTVLESQIPQPTEPVNGVFEGLFSANYYNITGTTINVASVTATTAAEASHFFAGDMVTILGTDSTGNKWHMLNEVAVDGNPGTGVIALRQKVERTLGTSVSMRALQGGKNLVLRNFKIIHTSGKAHAMTFSGVYNFLLENVVWDGTGGQTNYAAGLETFASTIRNCVVRNYEDQVNAGFPHGFILNGIGLRFQNNTISNCLLAAVQVQNVYSSEFTNNHLYNNGGEGFRLVNSFNNKDLVIAENFITGSNAAGIHIETDSASNAGIVVANNTITACGKSTGKNGIYVKAQGIKVIGNTVDRCATGINFQGASRCTAVGNTARYADDGIVVQSTCEHISISGNALHNNGDAGIYLADSTYITIDSNTISDNNYGLFIDGTTTKCVISNNVIEGNSTNWLRTSNGTSDVRFLNNEVAGTTNLGSGVNKQDFMLSFTPTVTLVGGAGNTVPVYTTNTGLFRQVGDQVEVEVYLTGDGGAEGAGTGVLSIALPRAAAASHSTSLFWAGYGLNNAAEYQLMGQIAGSATVISLSYWNAINTTAAFTGADQNNATRTVRLKFRYQV